jgi:hypothetical protein
MVGTFCGLSCVKRVGWHQIKKERQMISYVQILISWFSIRQKQTRPRV